MLFFRYHKQGTHSRQLLCLKTNGNFIFENKSVIENLFMHQNAAKCTKDCGSWHVSETKLAIYILEMIWEANYEQYPIIGY